MELFCQLCASLAQVEAVQIWCGGTVEVLPSCVQESFVGLCQVLNRGVLGDPGIFLQGFYLRK